MSRDFEGFVKCVVEVLKPQLDKIGFTYKDIGLMPASHFISVPGVHWFFLVLWAERKSDGQVYEINQKLGGDIGDITERSDVEELISRILQKLKEEVLFT